jgi:hypothetical protein
MVSNTQDEQAVPIGCSLNQDALAERGQRWRVLAERALVTVETAPDGLRLSFAALPGVQAELVDLAGLEQECCGFAGWTARATARPGTGELIVLDVSGKTRESAGAVQGMFSAFREYAAVIRDLAASGQ